MMNHRTRKILYYVRGYAQQFLVPNAFFRGRLNKKLERLTDANRDYVLDRVDYYNKLKEPFLLSKDAVTLREVPYGSKSVYYYDFRPVLRHFPANVKTDYIFGDVNWVPAVPSLVKSRPISSGNANGVLLKMESIRHFRTNVDSIPYEDKIDKLVWRGAGWQAHRKVFLARCWDHPLCDVGQVNQQEGTPEGWIKSKMSIPEQLRYKFILSIEGNDVATNLKWIAQSNSLCFMTQPKMETWFMEERLIPNEHYVQLRDDYADLGEKVEHYIQHPDEAKTMIYNFQNYYRSFTDPRQEELIGLLVAEKYLKLSGQL